MMTEVTVLIVDDDTVSANSLRDVFIQFGFETLSVEGRNQALEHLRVQPIDLIVIDPGRSGISALSFIKELTEHYGVPIIVCSANARLANRIIAFEMGADDFVVKPLEPDEVVARARAILRRYSRKSNGNELSRASLTSRLIRFDDWQFNPARRELKSPNGHLVNLTSNEIELLTTFLSQPNTSLTRISLMTALGKTQEPTSTRVIDVMVSKLRRKLEMEGRGGVIKTVRGEGYILTADVTEE